VALFVAACHVAGPPELPDAVTATLVGPRCDRPGRPCRCDLSQRPVGAPPAGHRRFEIRLPQAIGTRSAVDIDGIGAVVRDENDAEGSCFYLDLDPGATYRVRYLAAAHDRNRGLTAAFSVRELGPDGDSWYDVVQQRCGTNDTPCHHESVQDWTRSIEGGHRFHDPCGSTRIAGMRVDGGLYDRHFADVQISFDLTLRHHPPTAPPRSACRDTMAEPDAPPQAGEPGEPADAGELEETGEAGGHPPPAVAE
jgi:hypothetical protein